MIIFIYSVANSTLHQCNFTHGYNDVDDEAIHEKRAIENHSHSQVT